MSGFGIGVVVGDGWVGVDAWLAGVSLRLSVKAVLVAGTEVGVGGHMRCLASFS